MKHYLKHAFMLFALAMGLSALSYAQSTDVLLVVKTNDGQEISHEMSSESRFYFEDNAYLVIEDMVGNRAIARYALADIQKITCQETTGTSETDEVMAVYPNPVHDSMVLLHFEGAQTINIYAVDGRLMRSAVVSRGQAIDVSDFPAGLYLVKTQQQTLKMIKL